MLESGAGREGAQNDSEAEMDPVQYPTNHVVGILDTQDQTSCAVDSLVSGGFLESEIQIGHGTALADRVESHTGRHGLQDLFIRLFQSVGLQNAEIEMRDRYEQALRDGRTVIAILAPTEERKDRAAQIVRECGAHFINFFGHLSVERIIR